MNNQDEPLEVLCPQCHEHMAPTPDDVCKACFDLAMGNLMDMLFSTDDEFRDIVRGTENE